MFEIQRVLMTQYFGNFCHKKTPFVILSVLFYDSLKIGLSLTDRPVPSHLTKLVQQFYDY